MAYITTLTLILLLLYGIFSWIIPRFLSWYVKKKCKILLHIGRMSFLYFKFCDVYISKDGFTVEIQEFSLRSNLLSCEIGKLLFLIMRGVRIHVDVRSLSTCQKYEEKQDFDFRNLKIPSCIITFAQFLAISCKNLNLLALGNGWLASGSAKTLNLDSSVVHAARTLFANATIDDGVIKLLTHTSDASLAELNFAGCMECALKDQGELSFENLYIGITKIDACSTYKFVQFLKDRTFFKQQTLNQTPLHLTNSDFLARIGPILPKNFSLRLGSSSIIAGTCVDTYVPSLECTILGCLTDVKFQPSDPEFLIQCKIDQLNIRRKEPVLTLETVSIESKIKQHILKINTILNGLSIFYDHNYWEFVQSNKVTAIEYNNTFPLLTRAGWLRIEATTEVHEGSLKIQLPRVQPGDINCRVSYFKLSLNGIKDSSEEWRKELNFESLSCSFEENNMTYDISQPRNCSGNPLSIGIFTALAEQGTRRIHVHALIMEWNLKLVKILQKLLGFYGKNNSLHQDFKCHGRNFWRSIQFEIRCWDCNVFLTAESKISIMIRLDSISFDNRDCSLIVAANGVSAGPPKKENSMFVHDHEEMEGSFLVLKTLSVLLKPSTINFNFDSMNLTWSPNLHLRLRQLWMESSLESLFFHDNIVNLIKEKSESEKNVNVSAINGIFLCVDVSPKFHFQFYTKNAKWRHGYWKLSDLQGSLNESKIFEIKGFELSAVIENDNVKSERLINEDFEKRWNETRELRIDIARICFPYEHQFSEAVQNELLSIRKWIKEIHFSNEKTNESLPCDLIIKINEWLFEICDDPFEVRIRDNYELLEDEYKESLKRHAMLEQKIQEMRGTHLLLPTKKVEELYLSLEKKNAEIYVQRWKQMQCTALPRTRLFAWTMRNLEILALADPSINQVKNASNILQAIDHETPWPEDGLEFNTLWIRGISVKCPEWKFQLRDFLQPLLLVEGLKIWGKLAVVEAVPPPRARRTVRIVVGVPWDDIVIERAMTSLKYYHDLNWDIDKFRYAFGPCWEPVIAQCNLSFEKILRPSRDPSPPLPFWDKMRLMLHGRLTLCVKQLTVLLHASLDPYNTIEEMEVTWSSLELDWKLGKIIAKGDFDVYVRTASKYDDCRLLHLPNVRLAIKLVWVCLGDPRDHHAAVPCAPDKLPEYSSNQQHDSFRAFRSQNVNVSLSLETRPSHLASSVPTIILYGSTLRWFENLKLILSGVTRPTRKGTLFQNVRPRKKQLSRHYRKIRLTIAFHQFHVSYWMSFAMQRGFEITGGRVACCSEHNLSLHSIDDGLIHRPRAEWSIMYMNCELNDTEIWLKSALQPEMETASLRQPVEKCYFLSVSRVSYNREGMVIGISGDTPIHRLVVDDLKGAWTKTNREVAFALFDTFIKSQQLKKNLSTDALKGFSHRENTRTSSKNRNRTLEGQSAPTSVAPSSVAKPKQTEAAGMLQKLIAEAVNKPMAFSDDQSVQARGQQLSGLAGCSQDDVWFKNWLIELVNSQVLLKGIETRGYVILSAAKAKILQTVHRPVWRERTLMSKTTWVGSLECMQYYATVNANFDENIDDNIMWLALNNIQEKDFTSISLPHADVSAMVGSGQSVGGVVSQTVGGGGGSQHQLQRIVSRCKCEFFYVGYGQILDTEYVPEVPSRPVEEICLWEQNEHSADAFTLMHYDLEVCTNSVQYAMILDIVNNLLLHVEPRRKEALARLQKMKFDLQLNANAELIRKPIQDLQNEVRNLMAELRCLEKETYIVQKSLSEETSEELKEELSYDMDRLETRVFKCKNELSDKGEQLDLMLSCFKEKTAPTTVSTSLKDNPAAMARAAEICFKQAQWRLTDADGQLGIADLVLSNFLYTKTNKTDDSVEHLLELGYVRMTNLLPNQIYTDVLSPTELQFNMPVDRQRALRVFCREKAPVGGISIKEHFEINVVPLTIGLTKKFYSTMLKFCFPERDPETMEELPVPQKDSSFYVKIDRKEDVEKMKERADKNKLFIYIKIPEVPVKVSYKGTKEKNLEDVRDFALVIPTLEYHNVTWTWLDLLLAMKSDTRTVILSQAIKQKLQIKPKGVQEEITPQEEDKARLLLGAKHISSDSKKKSMFKFK